VDFVAGSAGETKNDQAREIPIVPPLRVLLKEQLAKREPVCQYVCFRMDRGGRSVKIETSRKSWYMVPTVESAGKPVYAPLREPRSKTKQKITYNGMMFPRSSPDGGPQFCGGAPLEDMADLLGHRSLTMTRRCAHLGPNKWHAVVSLLSATDTTTDTEKIAQAGGVAQVACGVNTLGA
jgi:hypothetical protein